MRLDTSLRDHFEAARQQARAAIARGELERALEICDDAHERALQHGDQSEIDFAACSRHAVLLHMGHGDSTLRELQKILMRSADSTNRHLAAYNISFYYDQHNDFDKSRFYAQLALDHAAKSDSGQYLARSYNRLANLLIRESKFSKALEHYRQAHHLYTAAFEMPERLTILVNIGYCHLACGRIDEGFEYLFTVRRKFIHRGVDRGSVLGRLRLSFCYGYLEVGKPTQAKLHGTEGLRIAEECRDPDLTKKALYLLGEAEKIAGDEFTAYAHFARLQEEYYPDNPYLPDLLLDNDTKQLINLWA